MAKKTQEGEYTVTFPGGSPLYFKVITTYDTDANGNPIRGSSNHSILYKPNTNLPYYEAATTKDFKTFDLKKYTLEQALQTGNALNEDQTILGSTAARSLQIYDGQLNKATRNSVSLSSINSGLNVGQAQAVVGVPQTLPNAPTPIQDPDPDPTAPSPPVSLDDKSRDELTSGSRENTRNSYQPIIKYPENLNSTFQDCIKFSIVKYQPPGLSGFEESAAGSRFVDINKEGNPAFSKGKDREIIGTIVLPIPGGIQDSNTVSWSRGEINPFESAVAGIVATAVGGGDAGAAAGTQLEGVAKSKSDVRNSITAWAAQSVVGANNIMQRQFGTIINPNVELLFNTPELRTFSFSFKLSPRSPSEAQNVKTIIRNFKQAMSVKRSSSSFLLQSPHTFAISYIFKDQSHPYLNRFKECALISCNVNYTPEGNYMAFDDSDHPSMVSYQLDLIFQELEPLYDDEYGNERGDQIQNIGF